MANNPNTFNSIMVQRPKYNTFDMSHDIRYTFDMGRLVPFTRAIDVLPGDRWNVSVQSMLRMSPMLAPVMHQIYVKHYFFFVPTRLLWDGFEEFISDPSASSAVPYFALSASMDEGDIGDYLGYPIDYAGDQFLVDACPAAGYALIWQEWFMDQNLQTSTFVDLVTGNNGWARTVLESLPYPVSWRHDYFTSALTTAQRGTAVSIPLLASDAPITLSDTTGTAGLMKKASDHTVFTAIGSADHTATGVFQSSSGAGTDAVYDPNGTLVLATDASFNTIEAIRYAFRLQEYLEISMLAGTRYHEFVYAFFGIRTPDYRIGRPELIGYTSGNMVISEVLQTAPAGASGDTAVETPLGTLGGHGLSMAGGSGFNYYASEHGYLYGLIAVCPRPVYSPQGVHRSYTRMQHGSEQFYNYKFAHLGEQAILNYEVFLGGTTATDQSTWGYTPRYAEYREERSRIAGEMRSSLDHWHLARSFVALPALNEDFITVPSGDDANEDNLKRIFAVDYGVGAEFSNHSIIGHTFVKAYARRLIPKYGQPML